MTPRGGDDRGRGVNYWFKPPESALSGSHNYYSRNIFNLPESESIETDSYCATNDAGTLKTVETEQEW